MENTLNNKKTSAEGEQEGALDYRELLELSGVSVGGWFCLLSYS